MKTRRITRSTPRQRAVPISQMEMGEAAVRILCPGCGMSVAEGSRCPSCAEVAVIDQRDEPRLIEGDRAELW